jgi:hypothetical protein
MRTILESQDFSFSGQRAVQSLQDVSGITLQRAGRF